jgi:hypothetical protein
MSAGAHYQLRLVAIRPVHLRRLVNNGVLASLPNQRIEVIGSDDLDALLFIKHVLKRCRSDPVVLVDRDPWYNWALDDRDLCDSRSVDRWVKAFVAFLNAII